MRMTRDDDNNTTTILEMDNNSVGQKLPHQQNGSNNSGSTGGGGLGGGGGGLGGVGGGGGGLESGVAGGMRNLKQDEDNQAIASVNGGPQYTMPGVLHYIQHEFSRFEMERSQWDIDRAELQARIAVLLGERKGQESLKSDLIRRIKMLEYALKQERIKFHRLKFGCDPPTLNDLNNKQPMTDETGGIGNEVAPDSEIPFSSVSNTTWRQGRQLLRQYLQEIGYTDTIIDVRSNRVRALLGLNNNNATEHDENNVVGSGGGGGGVGANNINGNMMDNNKRSSESQGRRTPAKKSQPATAAEAEAAVMAALEFLEHTDVEMSDDDEIAEGLEMTDSDNDDIKPLKRKTKGIKSDDVDAEAEEVLNELNLLTESEDTHMTSKQIKSDDLDWIGYNSDASRRPLINAGSGGGGGGGGGGNGGGVGGGGNGDEDADNALGLGELAQLTVNNEDESTYDVSNSKETHRKTWNAKYTLRSHFDGVRALAFHPQEPVLITASEDHTLKLWNLQKTVLTKKSAGLDVEPLYTFRAHTGPVLCLVMSKTGEHCYSGGLDGVIHSWNMPSSNIDPYDSYDPSVLRQSFLGHTDAVWSLAYHPTKDQLVSCSADGTIKLWAPLSKVPCLKTFSATESTGVPSSVDFVRDENDRIVVAFNHPNTSLCIIYDTETGKEIVKLQATEMNSNLGRFINKVVAHPTFPISITAHEDRHIRFWDNNTGSLLHSMVAHLEPVTSLAIDAHGLYLLSGSHDSSIRLWNLENKTCVQEITAHRKKFDESIFDVAFHPYRAYIASAGADAVAKVFV